MRQDTFFEFTRELLDNPGRTVELNVPGGRLLFTDNVDNIKAIQFSQVKRPMYVLDETCLTVITVCRFWQRREDP